MIKNLKSINTNMNSIYFSSPALSQRTSSLWQKYFNSCGLGQLCHIGEKNFNQDDDFTNCSFAYNLIDKYSLINFNFNFKKEAWKDIKALVKILIKCSSSSQIYFTTDMQFMGNKKRLQKIVIEDFFLLNKNKKFKFNTVIPIIKYNKYKIKQRIFKNKFAKLKQWIS